MDRNRRQPARDRLPPRFCIRAKRLRRGHYLLPSSRAAPPRCSLSSNSAASGRAKRCAKTAPLPRSSSLARALGRRPLRASAGRHSRVSQAVESSSASGLRRTTTRVPESHESKRFPHPACARRTASLRGLGHRTVVQTCAQPHADFTQCLLEPFQLLTTEQCERVGCRLQLRLEAPLRVFVAVPELCVGQKAEALGTSLEDTLGQRQAVIEEQLAFHRLLNSVLYLARREPAANSFERQINTFEG